MPATPRALRARPSTRHTLGATVALGLVTGLGLAAPAVASPAVPGAASTSTTASVTAASTLRTDVPLTDPAAGDTTTTDSPQQPERTAQERRAAKKARQARKARKAKVRARKAKWAEIRRVGRAKNVALAQRGDSYGYGASGPHAFDCSGLVQFAYHRAGFTGMPRSSAAQAGHTRRIPKSAMRPGDLMFFANGGGVYHVGIFTGRGRGGVPLMVHSSRPGTPVQVAAPWTSSWFAGTVR